MLVAVSGAAAGLATGDQFGPGFLQRGDRLCQPGLHPFGQQRADGSGAVMVGQSGDKRSFCGQNL